MNRLDRRLALSFTLLLSIALTAQAQEQTQGLGFMLGNSTSSTLSQPNALHAMRFTATRDLQADTVALDLNAVTGQPRLRVALREDDGQGHPRETDLAWAEHTPSEGANVITLNQPAALQQGRVYHLVSTVLNGSAEHRVQIRAYTQSIAEVRPDTAEPDGQFTCLLSADGGETWRSGGSLITAVVGSSSGDGVMGQPYSGGAYRDLGGKRWQGIRFTSSHSGRLAAVRLMLAKPQSADVGPVKLLLFADDQPQQPIYEATLTLDDSTAAQQVSHQAGESAPTLAQGATYVLWVAAPQATSAAAVRLLGSRLNRQAPLYAQAMPRASSVFTMSPDGALPGKVAGNDTQAAGYGIYFQLRLAP